MDTRLRSEDRHAGPDPELDRLVGCDEALAVIASDVESLLAELTQMRGRAEALEEHSAGQQDLLRERAAEVARLEDEHTRALRRVEELDVALAGADRRIADLEARRAASDREHERLRASLEEHTSNLAAAQLALAVTRGSMREARLADRRGPATLDGNGDVSEKGDDLRPRAVTEHLRFVPSPDGYRLTTSDERCARPGDRLVVGDRRFVVTRVGRSPLPDDPRPCAFLLPDALLP